MIRAEDYISYTARRDMTGFETEYGWIKFRFHRARRFGVGWKHSYAKTDSRGRDSTPLS